MAKAVKVAVTAETRKAQAAFKNLHRELGLDKLESGLKSVATAAVATGAAVAAGAAAAGKSAISMASDFEQSSGAVQAIFKDQAAKMEAYSKSAQIAVGLSKHEYNELASVLGAQLKNGGLAMDKLGDKTNQLIELGADMSAMFGGTTADAVNALSSALKGERNPIERYGVTLKQATIDAKAAEMGFTKVGGALSAEAQQAATLALIMEQTSDAHGRFAKEGDTWAGMYQRFQAQVKNFMIDIGTRLMPVVKAVGNWIGKHLPGALDVATEFFDQKITPAAKRFAAFVQTTLWPAVMQAVGAIRTHVLPRLMQVGRFVTGTIIPAARQFVAWAIRNRDWILAIGTALAAGVVAWRAYQKAMAIWGAVQRLSTAIKGVNAALRANPIGLIIAGIAAFAALMVVLYKRNEKFRDFVNAAWAKIKAAISAVVDWWTTTAAPALASIWAAVRPHLIALRNFFTQTLWPAVKAAWDAITAAAGQFVAWFRAKAVPPLRTAFRAIGAAFAGVWNWFKNTAIPALITAWGKLQPAFRLLGTFFTKVLWPTVKFVFTAIKNVITTAFNWIKDYVIPPLIAAWNLLRPAFEAVGNFVMNTLWPAFKTAWDGISSTVSTVVTYVKDTLIPWFTDAFNTIKDIPNRVWGWMKDTYDKIVSTLTDAVNWVAGVPQKIINALSTMGGMLWDWAKAAFNKVKDGFVSSWNTVNNWLGGIPQAILDALGNLGSLLWQAGKDVFYGFWEGMKAVWYDIKNWLTGTVTDQIPQLKGPASVDKRLLTGNGRLIMQGLHAGLRDEWKNVARFLSSRGDVISGLDYGTLNANIAPAPANTPARVEKHYHITVNALDAGPAVGRRIMEAIKEYERAGGKA